MTTTTQLRSWWAPACTGPFARVALFGDGVVSVRASIVSAVHALSACLEAHDYRTRVADTGAYNCRPVTGGTGYSLHAYGTAIDINWQSNPYGPTLVTDMPPAMVADIKKIRTRNGKQVWRWGGDYAGNKDAMHFEVTCHPSDLATGIDTGTLPTLTPPPAPSDPLTEAHMDLYFIEGGAGYRMVTPWGIYKLDKEEGYAFDVRNGRIAKRIEPALWAKVTAGQKLANG